MKKIIIFLFVIFLISSSKLDSKASSGCPISTTTNHFVNLVNSYRLRNGLCPLYESAELNNTATIKACDISNRGYWSHTTPEGETFVQTITNNGGYFRHFGENLAADFVDEEAALQGLINSHSHRSVLLSPFTHIGTSKCGRVYVQHFGLK